MKTFYNIKSKIYNWDEIQSKLIEWRSENKSIVFSNGCFDILHLGHIEYLSKTKDLGDILIIGLNSDQSVKRLKGETRPINNEYSRSILLSALLFVDAVVVFGEDTPYELIDIIQPDILVKGGGYDETNIVGADIVKSRGGKVVAIDLIEGYSTTNIIHKTIQS